MYSISCIVSDRNNDSWIRVAEPVIEISQIWPQCIYLLGPRVRGHPIATNSDGTIHFTDNFILNVRLPLPNGHVIFLGHFNFL